VTIKRISLTIVFLIVLVIGVVFVNSTGSKNIKTHKELCGSKKCNVVLIYVDTLSAQHLSGNGYSRQTSPFIDEFFLNQGLVFKNAFSNGTWTVPSFASMFKSKLPSEITVNEMINSNDNGDFIDYLREAGVEVKAVLRNQPTTVDQAVDSRFKQEEIIQASRGHAFEKSTEWISKRASSENERPFFLMVHSWDVHHPFDPPEPYRNLFSDNPDYQGPMGLEEFQPLRKVPIEQWQDKLDSVKLQYDQGIRKTDDYLKNFIESFPRELAKDTVFILTADHGEGFAQHDNFVGHAFAPYQEIIHIPLSIKLPRNDKKIEINNRVSLIDLAPTILDIYGVKKPDSYRGQSLLSASEKDKERFVKSEFGQSLWLTNFKGLYPENEGVGVPIMTTDMVGGSYGKWKVMNFEGRDIELFNLENDPSEQKNIINDVDSLPSEDKEQIRFIFDQLGIKY